MTVPDLLPIGARAPDFTLPASDGRLVTLSALREHKHVVLIFYVGDNTPDCNRHSRPCGTMCLSWRKWIFRWWGSTRQA